MPMPFSTAPLRYRRATATTTFCRQRKERDRATWTPCPESAYPFNMTDLDSPSNTWAPFTAGRRDRIPEPDRLVWNRRDRSHVALRRSWSRRPKAGWLSAPFAKGPWSELRWGWATDGAEVWERRWWVDRPSCFTSDLAEAASVLRDLGVVVPAITEVDDHHVQMTRCRWAPRASSPSGASVRRFIESTLEEALHHGRILRVGQPHIDHHARLLVEDVICVERLESSDRIALAATMGTLARRDQTSLEAMLEPGVESPNQPSTRAVSHRIVGGLKAEWNSTAFILALRSVAGILIDQSAPSAPALWMFADELLHRLDLAHQFPTTVLDSPEQVLRLLDR